MARELETDVLIIGSGIAGLSAAIALAKENINTVVITAAPELAGTNTSVAQGGIIFQAVEADPTRLMDDILKAGCYVNYKPAVQQLAELGPELVRDVLLDAVAVPFDKNEKGHYKRTQEGAHSEKRILFKGDETGQAIQQGLIEFGSQFRTLRFLTQTTAVNLLMNGFHAVDPSVRYEPDHCFGAFVFDQQTNEVYPILARHTILATGGMGQLFLHNTNAQYARGDGVALAYRVGCRLKNLEYVQFHPTTFFHHSAPRFLISEAMRGEGGILVNGAGERFLPQYLPDFGHPELAPRDKLARAIHQEMLSTGATCVYLDISQKPAQWIQDRFPSIYQTCLKNAVDITQEPIPVVPAAHYHCGGVWTGLKGETSIPHLWAVGEVACTGLHGANRLASSSLLEGLVWGTEAGRAIAENVRQNGRPHWPSIDPWRAEHTEVDPSFFSQDWLTLKHTMWNYVGLIKTDARLKRAQGILTELGRGIDIFYRKAALSDALIGLRHASLTSIQVLKSCMRNTNSLGCYLREDLEI